MTQKGSRISWRQKGVEKTFLETCLHEMTLCGREGSNRKQISWRNVAEKLKTEHNFIADQRQTKNHYDYLKAKFAAWSKLKKKTVNAYNPVTNTFNLSEEEWQIEMKYNKYVEALRTSPLPHIELCVQLFEGSTSNGFHFWGSSSTLPHPFEEVADNCLKGLEDIECTQIEPLIQGVSDESSVRSKIKREPPTQGVSDESSVRSKNKREKQKDEETLNSKLIEVGDYIIKLANMLIEKHNLSNDMDACMEKLETMGWGDSDARYHTALLLFGESADIRKVWLHLQPRVCELWVKNAGAKYGLF